MFIRSTPLIAGEILMEVLGAYDTPIFECLLGHTKKVFPQTSFGKIFLAVVQKKIYICFGRPDFIYVQKDNNTNKTKQ